MALLLKLVPLPSRYRFDPPSRSPANATSHILHCGTISNRLIHHLSTVIASADHNVDLVSQPLPRFLIFFINIFLVPISSRSNGTCHHHAPTTVNPGSSGFRHVLSSPFEIEGDPNVLQRPSRQCSSQRPSCVGVPQGIDSIRGL